MLTGFIFSAHKAGTLGTLRVERVKFKRYAFKIVIVLLAICVANHMMVRMDVRVFDLHDRPMNVF